MPLAEARSNLEITMVANYITLTPGTLTVDVSPDRSTLLVHALSPARPATTCAPTSARASSRAWCGDPPMIIASVQTGILGAALRSRPSA